MPNRLLVYRLYGLITLAVVLLISGCERRSGQPLGAETDESNYRSGQRLVKQGRSQEALAAYLRVIEKRGDAAPESHLEAGIICLQQIKDPIAAIYHFRKYLERQPNSPQASQVRGLVESAKREFARTLPANPMENQSERLNMIEQFAQLQQENDQLRAELVMVRRNESQSTVNHMRVPVASSTKPIGSMHSSPRNSPISLVPAFAERMAPKRLERKPTRPVPDVTAARARRHVVVKGDTLFLLAQHYYRNRSKWRDIYEANRDQMSDENSLRIGMELRIP